MTNSRWIQKQLVGRRITAVRLRPFNNGCGGKATDPAIVLDDGTSIQFIVQETNVGIYGIALVLGFPYKPKPHIADRGNGGASEG